LESQLKIRDVEVTKLKEDHKLMIKQLEGRRSDQSQQGEAVTQVEDLCAIHACFKGTGNSTWNYVYCYSALKPNIIQYIYQTLSNLQML